MKKHTTTKLHKRIGQIIWSKRKVWGIALSVVVITASGTLLNQAAHAAANTVYIAPSAGTYSVGDTVSLAIRENSGSTGVYSEQVGLSYPKDKLLYVSIDPANSAFGIDTGLGTGSNGHVEIIRGSISAITNDQLIANVNFKVLAEGPAPVSFDAVCQGGNTSNCTTVYDVSTTNVISGTVGGTFTLLPATAPTCPALQVGTPPNCTTPTPPAAPPPPPPAPKPSGTSITPKNSMTPIVAPNNSQVRVSTPADIQPATIQPDGVQKVQYYLNNKLVYTANAVPYTYHLDTTHLLNGTYTLKSIKYFISGRQDITTQKLAIKNPFSLIQFGLILRHYLIEIIIPFILIVIAGVFVYICIPRIKWYKGPGSTPAGTPPAPTMSVQGPTVVTPTGS